MLGWLTGRIVAEEPNGNIIVNVNGAGYELSVPLGTLGRLPRSDQIELWVHTHVRTDVFELFGFASERERRAFRLLLGVPGIGPKTALAMLSALPLAELAHAVERRDLARLSQVPGIGKKTAERVALELRGKVSELVEPGDLPRAQLSAPSDPSRRLQAALTNMGYRPAEAERAISALGPKVNSAPIAELIRDALAHLTAP